MRHLGIDFGTKKVGLALSDEGGAMAFPHSVVPNDAALFDTVLGLIRKEGVMVVVMGRSTNLDGTANPVDTNIDVFGKKLEESGVQVVFEPEQYTSQEAMRIQGRNDMLDASAAALILNSYLTRVK